MGAKEKKHNLIGISQFAALKDVGRTSIQNSIDRGDIKPVIIGDRVYIDMDLYADFKPNKKIGRPATGTKKMFDELNQKIADLTEIVQTKL